MNQNIIQRKRAAINTSQNSHCQPSSWGRGKCLEKSTSGKSLTVTFMCLANVLQEDFEALVPDH